MGALRRYFIAGLLVWVPLGITALIIEVMVNLVYGMLLYLPPALRPDTFFGVQIPALGVVVAVVAVLFIVLVTGMVVTNLFGKPTDASRRARPRKNSFRARHLWRRQAGHRNAVLELRPVVSQGGAGAVPAPGVLEPGVSYR